MHIETASLDYRDGGTALQARVAWDADMRGPRPGVLVSHAWRGRTDFENDKAVALARLGYVGFALDLYGAGITGSSAAENRKLMQPLLDDRARLQQRMQLALSELRRLETVDAARCAAIGFCFGGLCVLDLARSGADIGGVASFHGLPGAPANTAGKRITASVLVMHGWDDPMAPPADMLALCRELTAQGADWQLHAYGHTLHAFSNPQADDAANGLCFNATAERRSWRTLRHFLDEIFESEE